ncbi:MAG: hypothetical protein H0T51_22865 [Pirellulales bacterium]|nr:hypothetical protein [Pirellulales bacterium]
MEIVEGEMHDPLTATYQTLELARLNDALTECGVSDSELRRRVCETYFFHSGYFLDGCWFAEDGLRYRPGIYFAEIDDQDKRTGKVHMPDPNIGTMFHEYAHGAAAWLYDDHAEDVSKIEVGDATGNA